MSRTRRNDRCSCGSGRKVKHCCGVERGPSESEVARALLSFEARRAAADLDEFAPTEEELEDLLEEAIYLPEREPGLTIALPRLITPDVERALQAIERDDVAGLDAALTPLVDRFDTPVARLELVRRILDARDHGRLDRLVAAVAIVDLSSPSKALMRSCIEGSLAASLAHKPAPPGLLIASR